MWDFGYGSIVDLLQGSVLMKKPWRICVNGTHESSNTDDIPPQNNAKQSQVFMLLDILYRWDYMFLY